MDGTFLILFEYLFKLKKLFTAKFKQLDALSIKGTPSLEARDKLTTALFPIIKRTFVRGFP